MILTKKCVLIYDNKGVIILKTNNNWETVAPESIIAMEFDTEEELEEYITDNNLVYDEPTE